MKRIIVVLLVLNLCLVGCVNNNSVNQLKSSDIKIEQDTSNNSIIKKLNSLPTYYPDKGGWQVDLRSVDISSLDLNNREYDLLNSDFDSFTVWSFNMPKNFNPEEIMKNAKDTGLNISRLHKSGITGVGVNIAIIGGWMPKNHIEYADRLKMYKLEGIGESAMQFHGSAVSSIAVGKTTWVAPEANLYYIGADNVNSLNQPDFTTYAQAVEEIVNVNKTLPEGNKIRVLSISSGWSPECKGYSEITSAIKRASNNGIFVISCNLFETYSNKFYFQGLKIDPLSDRNIASNYKIIPWNQWINMIKNKTDIDKYYEANFSKNATKEQLLIPIGCKTVASQLGENKYTFLSTSGWSWGIPFIAGLYALACQVNPNVTHELFWNTTLDTGDEQNIQEDNRNRKDN